MPTVWIWVYVAGALVVAWAMPYGWSVLRDYAQRRGVDPDGVFFITIIGALTVAVVATWPLSLTYALFTLLRKETD